MGVKKITETEITGLKLGESLRDTQITGFRADRKKTGVFFYLRYQLSGKRNTVKIGKHGSITVAQARELAKSLSGDVARGEDPALKRKIERAETTKQTHHTLKAFLEGGYLDVTSDKTAADVIPRVKRNFKEYLDKPIAEITSLQLNKWKHAYKGKASSCNRELTALRGVFTKAVNAGLIDISPMAKVKKLKEDKNKKIRFLTEPEEQQLLNAIETRQEQQREQRQRFIQHCKSRARKAPEPLNGSITDHIKPMVILALNTGLRRGELFNLKTKDIDLCSKYPSVTVVGDGEKTGQTRLIPLNNTTVQIMTAWLNEFKPIDYVFPSPKTGERMDNIKSAWVALRKAAGLPDLRLHDLRHTFGTRLAHARVDLVTIKELMGHEDLETTARYLHTNNERKLQAVALLSRAYN
ncbi:site-specific integrase [uncultured Endozoicomonas sp.]|uniref:site-specific integrase n=1 Tax=uncultured Endozoicomonas sp. TaxID=432652 RepID=UPI002605EA5F|nr:site-specific integrase [uncultured Endozoicomonas sp.]